MSTADKLQFRTLLVGIALTFLTALEICAIYGLRLFETWPWVRFSLVMSVLTCLWAYTFWFGRLTGGNKNTLNPIFFALAVIPFDVILLYPGTTALGLHSDENLYVLLFALEATHGVGFYFIQQEIKNYLKRA